MTVYDNLEFKHFVSIIAIAEAGTITAAGGRIALAQPALSRQISDLEEALHIELFKRERGGSTPTPAGELLIRFGRDLLQTRMEVVNVVQATHHATFRPFRLGFTPFVDRSVIGTVVDAYRGLFPKGDIAPQNGDTDDLIMHLSAGELDAALVTLPVMPDGIRIQPIMHEALVVCIRKDDPLADLEELPPEMLNEKLAIFSDPRHHPKAHAKLVEMLEEQGIKPQVSRPTFNSEHVQLMVRERLCVALIRKGEPLDEDLTTRPIQGVRWTIDFAIAYRDDLDQMALPLLLRDLEKRFSSASLTSDRKPPQRAKYRQEQRRLFFDGKSGTGM